MAPLQLRVTQATTSERLANRSRKLGMRVDLLVN
jgi:hypothetical protein